MEEDFRLFQEVKKQPIRNCVDLGRSMRGKRRGVFYFTESFRIDFENKMAYLTRLQKENDELRNQVDTLDKAYSGAIKESKKWFDIAHIAYQKRK